MKTEYVYKPLDNPGEHVSPFDPPQSAALYQFPVNPNQSWLRKKLAEVREEGGE